MPVITLFSGSYCNEKQIIEEIASRTGYRQLTDPDIVAEASRLSSIPENKIVRVFSEKVSVFNRLTHERERSLAYLRLALSSLLAEDEMIISGFARTIDPERHQPRSSRVFDCGHDLACGHG